MGGATRDFNLGLRQRNLLGSLRGERSGAHVFSMKRVPKVAGFNSFTLWSVMQAQFPFPLLQEMLLAVDRRSC